MVHRSIGSVVVAAVAVLGAACAKEGGSTGDAGQERLPHPELPGALQNLAAPSGGDTASPHAAHGGQVSRSEIAGLADDAPVLVVDGTTFTKADLERAILQHATRSGFPVDTIDGQVRDAFERPAYEKLIERKLLGAEAKKRGLWPTDAEIDREADALKATLPQGKTMQEFLQASKNNEQSFRDELASDVAMRKLIDAERAALPAPAEAALKKLYADNQARFATKETASGMQILIGVPRTASTDVVTAAQKRADELLAEAQRALKKEGEEGFKKLAAERSDDPTAKINRGDAGTFARGDMLPEIETAAFSMKKGELKVVRTERGFHVFLSGGSTPGRQLSFDEVKARLGEREATKALYDRVDALIGSLRAAAKIERVHEPLQSPIGDDGGGSQVPSWRPGKGNASQMPNPHKPG